jgi:hypothetical protein
VVLAVLGYALNDSGVAVPGMMLGIANAVLVCLVVWTVTDLLSAPSPLDEAHDDAAEELVRAGSRR